jgi:hypothetical protein
VCKSNSVSECTNVLFEPHIFWNLCYCVVRSPKVYKESKEDFGLTSVPIMLSNFVASWLSLFSFSFGYTARFKSRSRHLFFYNWSWRLLRQK